MGQWGKWGKWGKQFSRLGFVDNADRERVAGHVAGSGWGIVGHRWGK